MLASLTKDHVRPLVELNDQINKLTSHEREINSTRIVVLGDQSHGKSSVLEALSGVDLPRGEDIKTRVPLIMQLRKCADDDDECAYISRSGVTPVKIALDAVASKVDEFTAAIAGDSKAVCDQPINLKIVRHDQDDMTLVDLPGITRVAREGQGSDGKVLEEMILKMCRKYAEPPESIILNVASAMVDFSTSASLQLSQELDPEGRRTMLCVTKIDQHKESGLAKKLRVAIETMKLRAGHVFAVRNRKQEENDRSIALAKARKLEKECIDGNEELTEGAALHSFGLGVGTLSAQLVKIQMQRIVETLPSSAKAIRHKIEQLQHRLAEIGLPIEDEQACKLRAIMLADECHELLCKEREGRIDQVAKGLATTEDDLIELQMDIDDFQETRRIYPNTKALTGDAQEMDDGLGLQLKLYPNHHLASGAQCPVSVSVEVNELPDRVTSVQLEMSIELRRNDVQETVVVSQSTAATVEVRRRYDFIAFLFVCWVGLQGCSYVLFLGVPGIECICVSMG